VVTEEVALSRATIITRLRAAGCVFAEDETDMLLVAAGGAEELEVMVAQRVTGLPLEYVVGWAEFYGLRIVVEPGVFVPRPRTEFLADQAIDLAARFTGAVVVDLCCGTGALGAAVLANVSAVELYAVDIDPVAVRCARRNLAPGSSVFEGDLYAPLPSALRGRVEIMLCNAPYVPTAEIELMPREARLYEAHVALDGGGDGLDVHRRVAVDALSWLAPGGHLLIETSQDQAARAVEIFSSARLAARVTRSDELDATVVVGTRTQ